MVPDDNNARRKTFVLEQLPFCNWPIPIFQIFDVDGDGTPELLVRHQPNQTAFGSLQYPTGWYASSLLAIGSAAPFFGSTSSCPTYPPTEQGRSVLLGDLNGDGLVDMWHAGIKAKAFSNEATIWLNTGEGFAPGTLPLVPTGLNAYEPAPGDTLMRSALVDADGDGRLDVLQHWISASSPLGDYNLSLTLNGTDDHACVG